VFLERLDSAEFAQALQEHAPNFTYQIETLVPPSLDEIAQLEQDFSLELPDDLKQFWLQCQHGLSGAHWEVSPTDQSKNFFSVGFDFLPLQMLRRDLPDFRDLAKIYSEPGDTEEFGLELGLHKYSVPLSYSEPQLVLNPQNGLIYWRTYDGAMQELPIAPSFQKFFEHYLASGCFCSHDYKTCWKLMKPFVPNPIPLEKNIWLNFYRASYPQFG
jgi:SMI1 / KNR4 family (SUKH-1)